MLVRCVQLHNLLLEAQRSAASRSLVNALVEHQTISQFGLSSPYWLVHPILKWSSLIHIRLDSDSAFCSLRLQRKDLCTHSRTLPHSPMEGMVTFKGCHFGHNIVLQQRGARKERTRQGGRKQQLQRECICVPLLLYPDSFPLYKHTPKKGTFSLRLSCHMQNDRKGVQRTATDQCFLFPTKGTAVGQVRTGSFNLACLTAQSKAKYDLRHHIFS